MLVAGADCKAVAEAAAKLEGAAKVLLRRRAPSRPSAGRGDGGAGRRPDGQLRRGGRRLDGVGQEHHAARGRAARRHADLRHHQGGVARHLRAPDLRRQRHPDRAIGRQEKGHHRAHHRLPGGRQQRIGSHRGRRGASARRPLEFREGRDPEIRPAGADRGQDRRLGRPRPAVGRELQEVHRAGRRQAGRRGGRKPRRGRRRLHAQRLPGRADRQGGGARALHRGRHFRRHPASRPA